MVLTLKSLNEDATLNNYTTQNGAQITRGSDAKLILQLWQVDRNIRYIPAVGAVITVALIKSDQTILNKTATIPFADDRSILQFTLTAAETALLIGQNLIVTIVEGAVTSIATLQQGLQMLPTSQVGC